MLGGLTWARDLAGWYTPENSYDRGREKGPDLSIPNLRWVSNFIYELPVGKGRKFGGGWPRALDMAAGGWSLSGIALFQSGGHLTVTYRGRDVTGTAYTTSTTAPFVSCRPDRIADGNLDVDLQTLKRKRGSSARACNLGPRPPPLLIRPCLLASEFQIW